MAGHDSALSDIYVCGHWIFDLSLCVSTLCFAIIVVSRTSSCSHSPIHPHLLVAAEERRGDFGRRLLL